MITASSAPISVPPTRARTVGAVSCRTGRRTTARVSTSQNPWSTPAQIASQVAPAHDTPVATACRTATVRRAGAAGRRAPSSRATTTTSAIPTANDATVITGWSASDPVVAPSATRTGA